VQENKVIIHAAGNDFVTAPNKPPKCFYYSDAENNSTAFNAIYKFPLATATESAKVMKTMTPSNYYADHDTSDEDTVHQPAKRMRLAEPTMNATSVVVSTAPVKAIMVVTESDCDNSVGSLSASVSSAVTEYSTTESTLSSDEESDWDEQAMWDEILQCFSDEHDEEDHSTR
jgi:hypothetical protein